MSEQIKVGDLVMVVRATQCCGNVAANGWTYIVRRLVPGPFVCYGCRKSSNEPSAFGAPDGSMVRLSRLKRIPPLSELEGERTQEDIREPA